LVYKPHFFHTKYDYSFIPKNDKKDEFMLQLNFDHQPNLNTQSLIYRSLIFNKKRKRIITIDTFLDKKNDWISMVYLNESKTKYNVGVNPRLWVATWDLTADENILSTADIVTRADSMTIKNMLNLTSLSEDPFALFNDYFYYGKLGNYKAYRLGEQQNKYYTGSQPRESLYNQAIATYYSFTGEQEKSDSVWNILTGKSTDATTFVSKGTIDDLKKEMEKHQVVMFNEAHNVPKHRYLLGTLLDEAYKMGFRYLGLEAFYEDSIASIIPSFDNGFYLRDPVFGNLIREARRKGFYVVGYDSFSSTRETKQAQNLYDKSLKNDPYAKILVLAGYSHIDTTKMAGKFYQISGIKPLSIDQTYTYLKNVGIEKLAKDTVYVVQDSSFHEKPNVDIILFNNIKITNNCFAPTRSNTQIISIPDNFSDQCTVCCIYDGVEMAIFDKNPQNIPIPVAVYNIENKKSFEINLCEGSYKALFFDDYGKKIREQNILVK
jgi:hypothetical protein